MKKAIFSIILLTLISCSEKKHSDLNGNVESLQEKEYDATEKFGELIKGDLKNVNSYTFDNDGNLLKIIAYDSDGDKSYESNYQYKDGKNILVKTQKKDFNLSTLKSKDVVETQKLISDENSQAIWTVNSEDQEKSYVDTVITEYDNRHYPKTSTTKKHDGTQSISYFTYDKNGKMIEFKWLMNGKDTQQWEKYEYKDNLLVKQNILFMYGTERNDSITFNYKKDDKLNWIERIRYENGKVDGLMERTINYR